MRGDRAEVEFARAPGRCNPCVKVIRKLPQLDPNFVRRYVNNSSRSARLRSRIPGPIEHGREHRAMEVEQVDIGWRPDGSRCGARPVENECTAPRFRCAQHRLDFLVGRQNALMGFERFRMPNLPSHGLARATRPKHFVDSARNDFRGNVVTLNAHRLLNASDHTSSPLGRLPIPKEASDLGQLRRPCNGRSARSTRHSARVLPAHRGRNSAAAWPQGFMLRARTSLTPGTSWICCPASCPCR